MWTIAARLQWKGRVVSRSTVKSSFTVCVRAGTLPPIDGLFLSSHTLFIRSYILFKLAFKEWAWTSHPFQSPFLPFPSEETTREAVLKATDRPCQYLTTTGTLPWRDITQLHVISQANDARICFQCKIYGISMFHLNVGEAIELCLATKVTNF